MVEIPNNFKKGMHIMGNAIRELGDTLKKIRKKIGDRNPESDSLAPSYFAEICGPYIQDVNSYRQASEKFRLYLNIFQKIMNKVDELYQILNGALAAKEKDLKDKPEISRQNRDEYYKRQKEREEIIASIENLKKHIVVISQNFGKWESTIEGYEVFVDELDRYNTGVRRDYRELLQAFDNFNEEYPKFSRGGLNVESLSGDVATFKDNYAKLCKSVKDLLSINEVDKDEKLKKSLDAFVKAKPKQ